MDGGPEQLTPPQTIDIIRANWYTSARQFKETDNEILRKRALDNCNALMDAHSMIIDDLGKLGIKVVVDNH